MTIPSSVTFNSTSNNSVEATYEYWDDNYNDPFTTTQTIEFTVNPYTVQYEVYGGSFVNGATSTQYITSVDDKLYTDQTEEKQTASHSCLSCN